MGSAAERDSQLLSGEYRTWNVPFHLQYLLHYFKGEEARAFLGYRICFGCVVGFTAATGYVVREHQLHRYDRRLRRLLAASEAAQEVMTEESLSFLEDLKSGRIRLTDIDGELVGRWVPASQKGRSWKKACLSRQAGHKEVCDDEGESD